MSAPVMIPVGKIAVGSRVRPSTAAKVASLAGSIEDCARDGIGHGGLRSPIEVRAGAGKGQYMLVSGLNRLRAVEALGRKEIAAFVVEADDLRAELLELEENLVRADLTALDRAFFVKRFREIFEAEHGEIEHGGDRKSVEFKSENQKGNLPLWSEAVLERLGMSEDKCKRALRIANSLHPDIPDMLRGTGWDENQKALLELCGVTPPEAQEAVVTRLLDPDHPAQTMREAILGDANPKKDDPEEQWFTRSSGSVLGAKKRLRMRLYREVLIHDTDALREAVEAAGYALQLKMPGAGEG